MWIIFNTLVSYQVIIIKQKFVDVAWKKSKFSKENLFTDKLNIKTCKDISIKGF